MFRNTSKPKAFLTFVIFALISWGCWHIGDATPGYTGHLVCAGPFLMWTAIYFLVWLSKFGRDRKLASERPAPPALTTTEDRPTSRGRYYVPGK